MVANAPRRGTLPPRPAPRLAVRPSPAPASPLARARLAPRRRRLVPSAFPRERKTELRSHRTISIMLRAWQANWNAMKPQIQCVPTP